MEVVLGFVFVEPQTCLHTYFVWSDLPWILLLTPSPGGQSQEAGGDFQGAAKVDQRHISAFPKNTPIEKVIPSFSQLCERVLSYPRERCSGRDVLAARRNSEYVQVETTFVRRLRRRLLNVQVQRVRMRYREAWARR